MTSFVRRDLTSPLSRQGRTAVVDALAVVPMDADKTGAEGGTSDGTIGAAR